MVLGSRHSETGQGEGGSPLQGVLMTAPRPAGPSWTWGTGRALPGTVPPTGPGMYQPLGARAAPTQPLSPAMM